MAISTAVSSGCPSARPEPVTHVVLKHDRAGKLDCFKPYHIDPLRRYCANPPGNSAYKLLGIYPSERAALAAMDADWKHTAPPLTEEQRAILRSLGRIGKEARP